MFLRNNYHRQKVEGQKGKRGKHLRGGLVQKRNARKRTTGGRKSAWGSKARYGEPASNFASEGKKMGIIDNQKKPSNGKKKGNFAQGRQEGHLGSSPRKKPYCNFMYGKVHGSEGRTPLRG